MRTGLYKTRISVKSMGFCTLPLAKVAKVLGCVYRAQKSKEENHTLARKKIRTKNIIFSLRNLIFKCWFGVF